MSKWIYVQGGDERLCSIVENALRDQGYSTETVPSEELSDRIRADLALICHEKTDHNRLILGDLTMDLNTITAFTRDGTDIHFTPIEFSMLSFLIKNKYRAVPRNELLSVVWGFENSGSTRVADDTAKRLRRKLSVTTVKLETVWNYGFRVREA